MCVREKGSKSVRAKELERPLLTSYISKSATKT